MGKVGPTPRNLSFIMLYETDLNQCPKRDETHEWWGTSSTKLTKIFGKA